MLRVEDRLGQVEQLQGPRLSHCRCVHQHILSVTGQPTSGQQGPPRADHPG